MSGDLSYYEQQQLAGYEGIGSKKALPKVGGMAETIFEMC